ncbi:hypothetical protein Tco_1526237 [Tanacetum coccineum]
MEHGIIYKKEGGCKITGYSDSSYGINTDKGKGTIGIVFYFGESPITWCTQKQLTVALSSCESEFMAATGAACQALWFEKGQRGRKKQRGNNNQTLVNKLLTRQGNTSRIHNNKRGHKLWDSLKTRHVGEEKVQQARLQSLMIEFNTLQMKDDDMVDAFTAKLNGYATKARELGKTLDESLLVRKLLDFG